MLLATQKALQRRRLIDEIEYLRQQLSERYAFANMVSRNPVMLEVFSTIEMLAQSGLYPSVAETTRQTLDHLSQRWSEVAAMPLYRAFESE